MTTKVCHTVRIWKDGELIEHRCVKDREEAVLTMIRFINDPPEDCLIRLYRGEWSESANIPIEHLMCEELPIVPLSD